MKFGSFLAAVVFAVFALTACALEPAENVEGVDGETTTGEGSPSANVSEPEPAPEPTIIVSGTVVEIMLIDPISTDINQSGDEFLASLAAPITVDGTTVVEEGVRVRGRIVDVQEPGRVSGRARIEMTLTEIVGQSANVPIATLAFVAEAEADLQRDAILGAAGGAAGAVGGGLVGGRTGAVLGGAAGAAGTVLATRGDQLEYPAESRLNFTLSQNVEIPAGQTIS